MNNIVRHIIKNPFGTVVKLITDNGLGIIEYCDKNDIVTIYGLSVENNNRGLGIGTFLLNTVLKEVDALHKKAIIFVDKENKHLQYWYMRYGFKIDNSHVFDDEEDYTYMIRNKYGL